MENKYKGTQTEKNLLAAFAGESQKASAPPTAACSASASSGYTKSNTLPHTVHTA